MPPVGRPMEDAVLRTIARLDGTPFPSTAQLAWRWLRGRVPGLADLHVSEVGAVIGAHVGPGMIAVVVAPAE